MGNTIDINKEKVHLKSFTCSKASLHFPHSTSSPKQPSPSKQPSLSSTTKTTKNKKSLSSNSKEEFSQPSSLPSSKNQNSQNSPKILNKPSKTPQRRRSAVELLQSLWKQRQRREHRSVSSCSLLQIESPPNVVSPDSVVALEASLKEPETFDALMRWGLLKVSVDTMAITALPLDCTIVPASNHSLWKKQPQGSHTEAKAYSQIMLDPALKGVTPNFIREIQHRNEVFIEIQDLLAEVNNFFF
uniref:Uncharacterized protein n=1 Tax=Meloidogyne incognita TaxID=6306 RepID=A0A914LR30_MELIC